MPRILAPLPNWNVRGFSYGELQPNGEHHPGADLNVGYGDDDLGLPVLCFADGTVVQFLHWDGHSYGFGNAALVEHHLFSPLPLWSLYAHLDSFSDSLIEGSPIAAGDPIGACGKSGGQTWAHLHFELRHKGPPEMPAAYWGGRLNYEAQSTRFADPYTLLRVLEGVDLADQDRLASLSALTADRDALQSQFALLSADRDFNYRLKMTFEAYLRQTERTRQRVRKGTADRLIAQAAASPS